MGLAAALALLAGVPAHASTVTLANHREVHEFAVSPSSASSEVTMIGGRLVSETKGSDCDGYTVTERFVMRGVDDQDQETITDIRSQVVEKGDQLDFSDETHDATGLAERSSGSAARTPAGTSVKMTLPWRRRFAFGSPLVFPVEQEKRIIEAALAGKRFLAFEVYDGSPDGATVYETSTIIGAQSDSATDFGAEDAIATAGYAGLRHWPVTISYFEKGGKVDAAPVYEIKAIVYENGVRRSVVLSYDSGLVLEGRLTRIDPLAQPDCLR